MLKLKSLIGTTGVTALVLASVVGCGSSTPSTSQPPASKSNDTSTTTSDKTTSLSGTLTALGSTALQPLVTEAAKEFQQKNPNVTVQVSGGGSFTGINQVEAGSVNIGDSDVPAPSNITDLTDHQVAIVPFVLAVNPDVTVKGLTQQQAKDIFTGKIKNWSQVGGKDEPIVIVNRPTSSGTRATIQKLVLGGADYASGMNVQDSNGAVKSAIASTKGAIGAIGAAYIDNTINVLTYDNVAFSDANVENGTYKIASAEHMFTKGQDTPLEKAFIDFIMSKSFQDSVVPQMKFVTVLK